MNEKPKKILANRVYSDATLKSWTKADLIEQIRILEHNWSCAEERYNNSVKNSEKIFFEQKAEIETLKGELKKELVEHEEFTKKAKAEIERLTKELKNCGQELIDSYREQEELQDRISELQKQVDELIEQRDVFKKLFEACNNSSITETQIIDVMNSFYREQAEHLAELKIEQAVKDTVKEICDLILEHWEKKQFVECDWLRVAISEKYGVEVE